MNLNVYEKKEKVNIVLKVWAVFMLFIYTKLTHKQNALTL